MTGGNDKMLAVVLQRRLMIEVREVPQPRPKAGEVLIRVRAAGICGSDLQIYATGRMHTHEIERPLLLGHEIGGEVAQLGEGVNNLSIGQPVVVEPGLACGRCVQCRSGRYNLCPNVKFLGQPPCDGGMAEYLVAPAEWVYPLPDGLSMVEGAVVEPLAVALHAVEKGQVGPGSTVAIYGAGPIGLLALQGALARGAKQVFIVDVLPNRLRIALELGATAALNATEVDPVKEIRRLAGGGVDVAIEASGSPQAILQLFRTAARGATVALVSRTQEPTIDLPYTEIVRSAVRIETVFRYVNHFQSALDLMVRGLVRVLPIVTHTFSLVEAPGAFALAHERKGEVGKIVLLAG